MSIKLISTALVLSACVVTMQAFAQMTRTEEINQEKAAKAASVQLESREEGDRIITKVQRLLAPEPPALSPTFGDFRPGAGLAGGVAYAMPASGALWTTKAAWSIKNFKQASSTFELQPMASGRLRVTPLIEWNDAPGLSYYGLGNSSPRRNEVTYGLRSIEAGAEVQGRAGSWFRYGVKAGYLGARSSGGNGPNPSVGTIFTDEGAPGLGSAPAWVHGSVYVAIDTRESAGYTRRGGLYGLAFHRYSDRGGQYSFDRTEVDLRQFIPVLHNNWIVALQGRAEMTDSERGQVIPYFMLPTIGGRNTLPGFEEYRFADRDSLLLRSELRWTPTPLLDMAVFFDQGKVASRVTDLDFHGLKRVLGIGGRIHSSDSTLLRLEVGHSVEGWGFVITQGLSF